MDKCEQNVNSRMLYFCKNPQLNNNYQNHYYHLIIIILFYINFIIYIYYFYYLFVSNIKILQKYILYSTGYENFFANCPFFDQSIALNYVVAKWSYWTIVIVILLCPLMARAMNENHSRAESFTLRWQSAADMSRIAILRSVKSLSLNIIVPFPVVKWRQKLLTINTWVRACVTAGSYTHLKMYKLVVAVNEQVHVSKIEMLRRLARLSIKSSYLKK